MVLSILGHLQNAAFHIDLSNQTLAMQKDGQQSLNIGFLAMERMAQILEEMKNYTPELDARISYIPLAMGAIVSFALPYAEAYLKKNPNPVTPDEKILFSSCKLLQKASPSLHGVLQHADIMLNTACLVHATALIALGSPVAGSIALLGLFTLALKRNHLLPVAFEQHIEPFLKLASLCTVHTLPINIILRILIITIKVVNLSDVVLNYQCIKSYLPPELKNPFHSKHVVQNNIYLNKLNYDSNFLVNPTHVFSDEVGRLLPTDFDQRIQETDAEVLFDQLDTKIENFKIVLNKELKEGLNNLKICAIKGRVLDTTPPDIDLFKKIVKSLVQSILEDDTNFAVKVKEFASIGNSCIEGWTREVNFLLHPQTKNAAWAIHHVLANMRSELIKDCLANTSEYQLLFSSMGGNNNVHLVNSFQAAFWHRFRTFDGELLQQLKKPSPVRTYCLRNIIMSSNMDNFPFLERIYMACLIAYNAPGCGIELIAEKLIKKFRITVENAISNPSTTVDIIYSAIKPEYRPAADGRVDRVDSTRVISWDAIQTWMSEFSERRNIDLTEKFDVLVERDMAGEYCLSKAGVRLLLLDLGILNYRSRYTKGT